MVIKRVAVPQVVCFMLVFIAGLLSCLRVTAQSQPAAASAGDTGVSMRVLWRVSEYKLGKDAAWGEEEARKQLFKTLDIDEKQITFDGSTCRDLIFKKELINARKYLDRAYGLSPSTLGIDNETVEIIKSNCKLPGFAEYIRLGDRRLVINIKGVFFFFEPVVNY